MEFDKWCFDNKIEFFDNKWKTTWDTYKNTLRADADSKCVSNATSLSILQQQKSSTISKFSKTESEKKVIWEISIKFRV